MKQQIAALIKQRPHTVAELVKALGKSDKTITTTLRHMPAHICAYTKNHAQIWTYGHGEHAPPPRKCDMPKQSHPVTIGVRIPWVFAEAGGI